MKKIEYLKKSLLSELYRYKWFSITCFSITKFQENARVIPYRLTPQPWGFSFVDEHGEEFKIDDAKPNEALFRFSDPITVDETWAPNINGTIETTVGRVFVNAFAIAPIFGNRIPFINKRFGVTDVEDMISPTMLSVPKDPSKRDKSKIYTDDYIGFVNRLQDLRSLSQLATWSATPKGLLPPTGIEAFKKDLLENKYKGKLNDPVEVSKFEGELLKFDDDFLKDDPAYGTMLAGKITKTSRKKLFLTMGNELGFGDPLKSNTVTNSLNEGWPTDPKQFVNMMNGLRYGSFARGAETVNGGVSAKILLRAANNFMIVDTDCGVPYGKIYHITNDDLKQLVNRYVIVNKQPKLVENVEAAGNYLGKVIQIRSPQYCKITGDRICRTCAGENLAMFPTGLTIPLTEVSAVILAASLKLMHTSGTSTAKLNLAEALT